MTATYAQAKADMFALVKAARDLYAPGLRTVWQGKPTADNAPPPQDVEWVQVSIQHAPTGSRQASLGCQHGRRRWRRTGRLYVQCFAPLQAGGLDRAMELACIFRDAIQTSTGTPNGVWFREPTAAEVPREKNWECATASAAFTYDEVK